MTQPWFDAHLDLSMLAVEGRDMTRSLAHANVPLPELAPGATPPPRPEGPAALTLPSLAEGNVCWCLGTIFIEPKPGGPLGYGGRDDAPGAFRVAMRQLRLYHEWEARGLIRLVKTKADLVIGPDVGPDVVPTAASQPLRVILLMEGADPIQSVDHAAWWYDRGLRVVGLSWVAGTRYAGGDSSKPPDTGLTAEGRDLVRKLDDLGILHDFTHLHDDASHETLALIRRPPLASHSSSRSLQGLPSIRLLGDDLARAIASRGGMIGLPLYSRFLHTEPGRASIARTVDHVERLAQLAGGRRFVGLGSDMDGGFGADKLPTGIDQPSDYPRLTAELSSRGWSQAEVDGFRCDNWLRFFSENLPEK
ncbi:MAG: membrane dipeptidase [Planctomycetota bacterium]|nr:membrane dipeptidase [Planctomycetota bacterium]